MTSGSEGDSTSISSQENLSSTKSSSWKKHDRESIFTTEAEETPLLGVSSPPSAGVVVDLSTHHQIITRWVIPVIIALCISLQCGDQLMDAPLTRVYESICCYKYWEQHDPSKLLIGRTHIGPGALGGVQESFCKVPEIQSNVAALIGNLNFFNGIPSLILAVPFGILADRWGRKPILLLGLCSFPFAAGWIVNVLWFWQTFNIRLVWISALHGIMGGGSTVVSAMAMTVISDVVPDSLRASVFFSVSSASFAMNFLAPPVAAALMELSPWIPIFLGLGLETVSIPLMLLIPETLHHKQACIADLDLPDTPSISERRSRRFAPLLEIGSMLLADWRVSALALTFLIHVYSNSVVNLLLLQFVSTRYLISFAQATFVVSLRAGFIILVFLVLMPWISYVMITRWGYNAKKKDLVLTRASALVGSIGWVLIALSPSMPLFIVAMFVSTLGQGFGTLVRSFMTSIVSPGDVAKLYTVISVLDTLGMMAGSPFFAYLFKVGLNIGGVASGLPFLVLGAFWSVCAGVAFLIRIKEHERGEQEHGDIDEPLIQAT